MLQKFNPKNTSEAQKKILEKIGEQTKSSDLTEFICGLEKDYSLTSDEIRKELLMVYKRFLMFFLKNSQVDLGEVNKLINLKKSFGISSQEIGECHYECAQEIFNTNLLFLERETSSESSKTIDKFLFLSDRLFSLDSKKGYQYEISRVNRVLSFSTIDFEDSKNKFSEELYIKSIKSIQSGQPGSAVIIEEIKQVLGIDNSRGELINENIFKEQIKTKISIENGFDTVTIQNLKTLQTILSISEENFTLFITQESSPIIQARIEKNFKGLLKNINTEVIKNVSTSLLENKEKFLVSHNTILSLCHIASRSLLINSIKATLTSIKSKTTVSAIEKVETLITLTRNLKQLFLQINSSETISSEKEIIETIRETIQTFSSGEAQVIYKIYIENLMKEPLLTEEKEKNMRYLQNILNISETECTGIYKNVIGPIFQKAVKLFVDENIFSNDKKIFIENLSVSMKIDKPLVLILKTSSYRQKLQNLIANKSVLSTQDLKKS